MPPDSILSQHFKPVKMAGHSGATEAAQKLPSAASSRHVSVPPMKSIVWTRAMVGQSFISGTISDR